MLFNVFNWGINYKVCGVFYFFVLQKGMGNDAEKPWIVTEKTTRHLVKNSGP